VAYRLAYDALQLGCDTVEDRALFLHSLRVIIDLTRDGGHDLLLLACGVVETLAIDALSKPRSSANVVAVRRRSCGVNGRRLLLRFR
jgi:hypothetical protein